MFPQTRIRQSAPTLHAPLPPKPCLTRSCRTLPTRQTLRTATKTSFKNEVAMLAIVAARGVCRIGRVRQERVRQGLGGNGACKVGADLRIRVCET
jgi:hypothetical protein